jgi:hypothetical protein
MVAVPEVLERSSRCVLGFSGRRGPLIAPMAFWFDGSSLWMSTPAASVKAKALRRRPSCAVYVAQPEGDGAGAVATGTARVFGLHDPLGVAVHGPVVSTAMAALAARNTGTILGYIQDARHVPARFRPRNRVAVRITLDGIRPVAAPVPGSGVAPALPLAVSPAVRRALAGRRTVALATLAPGGGVRVGPVTWGAGFALTVAPGEVAPDAGPAIVHLGADPSTRPTAVLGMSLGGDLRDGRLEPRRATWWEGFDLTTVDLPATASTLTLPD